MRLIDSHCHLQAPPFATDRAEVVAAARQAGVERILAPGWDVASSQASLALAAADPAIGAAVGIHPHHAGEVEGAAWAGVEALAADARVVAIGETGLDYDRAFAPREAQLANLRRHLSLARQTGKPAILHCRSRAGRRDAQDDLLAELRAAGFDGGGGGSAFGPDRPPALLHSFSGPPDYAAAALELGLMISFSGLVFRAGEEASAAVARLTPADRLLIETDAPYLAPPGASKRRNEPRWVEVTGRWLAGQRGIDPDLLGTQLVANHDRAFGGRP
ncbi:MAG: TatD family hydrolase [Candidatus Limnocylindrales bacterium]